MVISVAKKSPSSSSDEDDGPDYQAMKNDLLDEAFAAAQKGDPKSFRTAMSEAIRLCIEEHVKPDSLEDDEEYE